MAIQETFKKMKSLPDELKKEVDDFVDFLLTKEHKKNRERKSGLAKGLIKMKNDFDEPLEDFNKYIVE